MIVWRGKDVPDARDCIVSSFIIRYSLLRMQSNSIICHIGKTGKLTVCPFQRAMYAVNIPQNQLLGRTQFVVGGRQLL